MATLTELAEHAELAREAFERGQAELAAGNGVAARQWLDRACRLAPRDQTLALALATACLGYDDMRAAGLFAAISAQNDVREAWLGLATARRRLGDHAGAAQALAEALQRHVVHPGDAIIADAIVRESGALGWCGLASNGTLIVHGPDLPLPSAPSRNGRRRLMLLPVTDAYGRHLLGSPIDAAAIAATEGCVSSRDGGIVGWAWHPGDPATDPVLTIRPVRGRSRLTIVASDLSGRIEDSGPLARPRGFAVSASALRGIDGPVHVLGRDGRDLLGSPLDPRSELVAGAAAAATLARLYSATRSRPPRPAAPAAMPVVPVVARAITRTASRRLPAVVVVPVYGGASKTVACLDSVLRDLRRPSRLIVVDDASPEPDLVQALDKLVRQRRITLIRNPRNMGFAASANAGLRAATGHDAVLLNSDTLVPPGWLDALRNVAYSAPDIGTVTPLSNDATILSYPHRAGGNPVPGLAATIRLDQWARQVNGGSAIEIPVGVGFCLYIRRACLDMVGLLRADVFAQGYGEENDFCLRARHLGWRHMAAPGVFVAHIGGHSFRGAARHLRTRNAALLERLHPGYDALIQSHLKADPLASARRRLDLVQWRDARRRGSRSVILVTHASGGGVERQVEASVERHRSAGRRTLVLRPSRAADGARRVTLSDGTTNNFPNLRYALPGEQRELQRLLDRERPELIEVHHLVGHDPAIIELIATLGVPYDVHVHDYAWLCARVALVGPAQRYCGEPEVEQCEACVADAGSLIDEDIAVAALRARSARFLAAARRVVVPSSDAAARIRRHFPAVEPMAQPHEDDAVVGEPPAMGASSQYRVCVIGAIGIHKGYQVVLDCARDAAARQLPLEFVVVGHTIDDRRLLATGRVFVTGSYVPDEAVDLIKAQNATLALLPSIFPETWCLGLGEAWRAGLHVAAFDIGAQAERIRRTGRGFLLPLGLPASAINDALVAASGLSRHE